MSDFDILDKILTKRVFSITGKIMRNDYTPEEKREMWNEIKTIQTVWNGLYQKNNVGSYTTTTSYVA